MSTQRPPRVEMAHIVIVLTVCLLGTAAIIAKDNSAETVLLSFAVSMLAVEVIQVIWWLAGGEPLRRGVVELRDQSTKIQQMIPDEVRNAAPALRLIEEAGIEHIHRTRGAAAQNNYAKWEELALGAQAIDLLGLTMYSEWLQQEPLRQAIVRVAKASGSVRILVLGEPHEDPRKLDLNCRVRLQQPAEEKDIMPGELKSAHRELASLAVDLGQHNFEVRPMRRCYPSSLIVRIGDYMFVAPYLSTGAGRDSIAFEVRRGGILFDVYEREFTMIWKAEAPSLPTKKASGP